jgi:hypothetical protein
VFGLAEPKSGWEKHCVLRALVQVIWKLSHSLAIDDWSSTSLRSSTVAAEGVAVA